MRKYIATQEIENGIWNVYLAERTFRTFDETQTESYALIEILAQYLISENNKAYYILGHTDNLGSLSANQPLCLLY